MKIRSQNYFSNLLVINSFIMYAVISNAYLNVSFTSGIILLIYLLFIPTGLKLQSIFILLPYQNILILEGSLSLYLLFVTVVIINFIFINNRFTKKYLIMLFVIFTLQVPPIYFFNNSITNVASFILLLMLLMVVSDAKKNSSDYFIIASKALVFSTLFSTVIALIPFYNNMFTGGYIYRFSGLWNNPNIFGMQLLICMSLVTSMIKETIISKKVGSTLLLFFTYVITLTKSRSAIYIFVIVILAVLLFLIGSNIRNNNRKISVKKLLWGVFSAILIFIVCIYIFSIIANSRGLISGNDDFTAGRLTYLVNNLTWLKNNTKGQFIILGLGIDNNLNYFTSNGYLTQNTHNAFVEMFISLGIFGFILWIYYIWWFLKKYFNNRMRHRYIFMLVLIMYMFTSNINASAYTYVLLCLFILAGKSDVLHRNI